MIWSNLLPGEDIFQKYASSRLCIQVNSLSYVRIVLCIVYIFCLFLFFF